MRILLQTVAFISILGLSMVFAPWAQPEETKRDADPGGLLTPDDLQSIPGFQVEPQYLREDFADSTRGFAFREYKYIVQDLDGNIIGHMSVSIKPVPTKERNLVVLKKSYDFAGQAALTLRVDADTFDPKEMEISFAGGLRPEDETAPALPSDRCGASVEGGAEIYSERGEETVHYYYDTVTVSIRRPQATTLFTFRRPLPSYDMEELFLLLNVLDVERIPPRSVWYLTAPFERATYAVLVERKGGEVIYGADAERHLAVRLRLTSEAFSEDYFVESLPPHRVVKFTAGDLAFTLWEDASEQTTLVPGGNTP